MDYILVIKALLMGLVEGLTEFLPISSTGHLILAGEMLNFLDKSKRDVFEIFIQLGAILAVCWEYRSKLWRVGTQLGHDASAQRFVFNVMVAFLPAAVLGLLFSSQIKAVLFQPVPVAIAFIVGGVIILWAERREHTVVVHSVDSMRIRDALKVGLAQCLALIPGTSRSGATIIGGLLFGLSRNAAAEFSFFLAIPTLSAASLYSLWKHRHGLSMDDLFVFSLGFVAAFVSALIGVRALLRFISNHTFTVFAWYRIVFGIVVLLTAHFGWVNWTL
ncbi:undecaprenyl-diphosphate phosphatase [Parachitinimonas caeni]|uniref:Undecaprenyl-diphosphatase n=1 Tax=Parachitinimonas caeni TaxID=3031301 RepID=A0ABT7E309_9NEIS|nr:undecaprenyl-diphosphate phosphatase [Parachitinimonas caeni]MDK2126429.1 undecaprenyl-diphosphate phosphatase [Parachitinimonas caeni]